MSKQVAKTRVYSLADAARELSRRKTGNESSGCPVDILGIVTDGHFVAGSAKQCLRIVDQSCSAFVTVNSSDGQSAKIGDIVRFNRVGLRRNNRLFFAKASDGDGDGIPHFYTPQWDDPEAGQDWLRLVHVIADGSVVHNGSPRDVLPISMQTDQEQVERLVDWYVTSEPFRTRTPLLSQIPHRPRTMEEMTSCVGIVGEIVALVEQVEQSPILPITHSLSRKRRRGMVPAPSFGNVILSEVCNPRIPCMRRHFATLLDPEMRFLSRLCNARDTKLPVRICNVRSEKASQVVPSHLATHLNSKEADDIVLLITKSSRMTILSNHDLEVLQQQQQQRGQSERQEEGRREISSSLAWRTEEGDGDGTPQMLALTATQGSSVVPVSDAVRVNGHIVQIREDGNFNSSTRSSSPTIGIELGRLANCSMQRIPNSVSFDYITIVLGGTTVGDLQVKANRSVLRKLLGENNRHARQHGVAKGSSSRTGQAFLDALIRHETRLRWELKRRGNDWEVQSLSLHEIM